MLLPLVVSVSVHFKDEELFEMNILLSGRRQQLGYLDIDIPR